jgi:hypothetical protein
MTKIIVFNGNEPLLDVIYDPVQKCDFGLHRDRHPDTDWGEFRRTRMNDGYDKEVEMTDKLKKILIEDITEYYSGEQAFEKLKQFKLIK